MAQIPLMLQLFIKRDLPFRKIFPGRGKDPGKIHVGDAAEVRVDHIMKTPPPMHPKGQRAALYLIPKRKFHLVAVSLPYGTGFYLLYLPHKGSHLFFFDAKLLLIGDALHQTSAADAEMGTSVFESLQRRRTFHLQDPPLTSSVSLLVDHKRDLLARKPVFYNRLFSVYVNDPPVGKFHFFHDPCINLSFFHRLVPS